MPQEGFEPPTPSLRMTCSVMFRDGSRWSQILIRRSNHRKSFVKFHESGILRFEAAKSFVDILCHMCAIRT